MRRFLTIFLVPFVACCAVPKSLIHSHASGSNLGIESEALKPVGKHPRQTVIPWVYMVGEVDGDMVRHLYDAFGKVQDAKSQVAVLEINSPGGIVDEGFMIVKGIELSDAHIVCVVDGEAASMAFYILQSCDTRIMTRRSRLMIHEPWVHIGEGMTIGKLKDVLLNLEILSNSMIEHVAHKMGMSAGDLRAKVKDHAWWMGWEEAKANNAVDYIVWSVDDVPELLKNKILPSLK